ncbi:PKD domain-containing protein [Haladaptatus pallidirubidus]|uniref:PKD domain-containing protein n=1 Tax=Haladaptatus pallidirubidus TaxID=1008152 RepID=UPI001D0FBA8B
MVGLTAATGTTSAQSITGSVSPTEVQVGETVTGTINYPHPDTIRVEIIWGDGTIDGAGGDSATFTHSYSSPGTYTVVGRALGREIRVEKVLGTVTVTPGRSGDAPGQNRVEVCHRGRTIEVPSTTLDQHLAHGDTEGPCPEE